MVIVNLGSFLFLITCSCLAISAFYYVECLSHLLSDVAARALFFKFLGRFWNQIVSPKSRVLLDGLFKMKVTKNFIVVTSVAPPTEDVKRLASLPDWTLVVVGDTKTPTNWSFPGVHFLSVDAQRALGYSVVKKIPFESYARKTIGYLYAIERGAEFIYDTDDDNKPFGKGLLQFDYDSEISGIVYTAMSANRSNLFQPYSFFGRPDMWPRGFPLEEIHDHENNRSHFSLCQKIETPMIQQGLVRKDPDVDAVYRMINADKSEGLNDDFNPFAPTVTLARDVYAPFNSQNTLFRRSSFFTLWLPISVAFRVTDIWRSYFAQKLVQLVGGNIAFYPPNAVQIRNAHSYLKDFKEEEAMYEKAGSVVSSLGEWTCSETNTSLCVIKLAEHFARNGFWGEDDVEIAKLWIDDLIHLNYDFPPLKIESDQYAPGNESERFMNCRAMELHLTYSPDTVEELRKREGAAISSYMELDEWCNVTVENSSFEGYPNPKTMALRHAQGMFAEYRRMALIVTNNYPFEQQLSILQRLYEPFFGIMIFCGIFNYTKATEFNETLPRVRVPISYVNIPDAQMHFGFYGYYCTSKIIELRLQNIVGYVVMSDDTVFNLFNKFDIHSFVQKEPEIAQGTGLPPGWNSNVHGLPAVNRTVQLINEKYKNDSKVIRLVKEFSKGVGRPTGEYLMWIKGWRLSDFYYLPGDERSLWLFHGMAELFYEAKVWLEIGIDKIADSLHVQSNYSFAYLWGGDRNGWEKFYNSDLLMMHPIKLSSVRDAYHRVKVCSYIIDVFKTYLFNTE